MKADAPESPIPTPDPSEELRVPHPAQVLVLCAITNKQAQQAVALSVVRHGVRPLLRVTEELWSEQGVLPVSAMVYDLAPWDDRAVEFLERLVRERPDMPVLLLLPPTDVARRLTPRCRSIPGLFSTVHSIEDSTPEVIETSVKRLLGWVPAVVLPRILERLTGHGPLVAFMQGVLSTLGVGSRITVAGAAAGIGYSHRTVERQLQAAALPTPKELIDWAVLFHIALARERTGRTSAELIRAAGFGTHDLYRIRRRLADRLDVHPQTIQDAELSTVLLQFAGRCRISGTHAQKALQDAWVA